MSLRSLAKSREKQSHYCRQDSIYGILTRMITSAIKNLPKSTLELTITISPDEVEKKYEKVMEAVVQNAEIQGFRKGKAPRNLVEKSVEKEKVYQEVLQELLPKAYLDAIKEHNIQPVVDPHIALVSPEKLSELERGKELVVKAQTATKPTVKLNNYKDKIRELKAKSSIWIPGKDETVKKPEEEKKGPGIEEIINTLLESTEVELSDILIEHEANKLLSQTLDEVKRLGLTLDQYLANTKRTPQDLRAEAAQKASRDLKLEFVLGEITQEEKLSVSPEDIEKVIGENKDPKVQENLRNQSYILGAILLQQKAIDFIRNL